MIKGDDDDHGDDVLWEAYTRDMKPIRARHTIAEVSKDPIALRSNVAKVKETKAVESKAPQQKPVREQPSLPKGSIGQSPLFKDTSDRTVARQLKKGSLKVEATLDLHGMTQDQAFNALLRFIRQSQKDGKRFLLVITGKGKNLHREGPEGMKTGVLREQLPNWLRGSQFKDRIVSISGATRAYGGRGAYFVRLRRHDRS